MNKLLTIILCALASPACTVHVVECSDAYLYSRPAYGYAMYAPPSYHHHGYAAYYGGMVGGCTNLNPNVCAARRYR